MKRTALFPPKLLESSLAKQLAHQVGGQDAGSFVLLLNLVFADEVRRFVVEHSGWLCHAERTLDVDDVVDEQIRGTERNRLRCRRDLLDWKNFRTSRSD